MQVARIGAYLESLRQSGGGGSGAQAVAAPASTPAQAPASPEARSLSPRAPHMIRSNSSGGVTGGPASPRPPRAAPPLRSFTGSPIASRPRPRLADLEFPPPPPDLPPPPEEQPPPPPPPPPPDPSIKQTMKEMLELKLVAEIKERADMKRTRAPVQELPPPTAPPPADPVARLVTELSESLNLDPRRPAQPQKEEEPLSPGELKAALRRTPQHETADKGGEYKNTDYKSQLKKVDVNKKVNSVNRDAEDSGRAIIDFKSRLRKVDSNAPATNGLKKTSPDDNGNTRSAEETETASVVVETEEEEKRRSTGSISSLKKLWESKEATEASPEERARPAVPSKPAGVRAAAAGSRARIYATPLPATTAPAPATTATTAPATATATVTTAASTPADDALAALRSSLDWCTNEVSNRSPKNGFCFIWICVIG